MAVAVTCCFDCKKCVQGRIACANVLSDLYAMGVVSCHNMLMLLAVSREFTDQERDVVIPLMMKGFQVILVLPNCTGTHWATNIDIS